MIFINTSTFIICFAIILNIIIAAAIILLEKKQPEKTISWLLILLLLPPIGLILYMFFGRNWKINKLNENISREVQELITPIISNYKYKEYIPLIELLANNSDSPIFLNNEVTIFGNGNEKFIALKKELLKAKHHIHLEYYIVKSDNIGNEIKDILIKKANEGVHVRFIMDSIGIMHLKHSYIRELRKNGVDVVIYSYFLAPLLRLINTQINYRNHRKIAIIDGNVGFLGGINIGDEYLGKSKLGYWRDTHAMIKGDFVMGLQAVFLDDFVTVQKANNSNFSFYNENFDKYFPISQISDGVMMQLIKSGPDSEFPSIMQGIIKMIYMATNHIYISSPYFVPPESVMEALKIAALSGIDVKIIFPEKADHAIVNKASKTYLVDLIRCGVEVYLYDKKSFIHAKSLTVDGKLCTFGTANMDIRSFELNYEINSVIYDEEITNELEKLFFEDLSNSRLLTLEEYYTSSKLTRLSDAFARVFSSLM